MLAGLVKRGGGCQALLAHSEPNRPCSKARVQNPALVLATKRSENLNADADIRRVKLIAPVPGSSSQQYPQHLLKQRNEFPLLCTLFLETMPAQSTWLKRISSDLCLRCTVAKHASEFVKITMYSGNQILSYASSRDSSSGNIIPIKTRPHCLYSKRDEHS